jgi:6-phosphogluconolactonase (cycloisomerase 2 family)
MLSRTILINRAWGSILVHIGSTLALLAMTGAAAGQAEESSENLDARIDRLIQQLDDDNPEVRDAATTDLIKIGQPAVAKLIITAKEGRLAAGQRADQILNAVSRTAAGLRFASAIKRNELQGAVTLVLSPDGKFVYVPAHIAGAINVFRRDAKTGQLTDQQTIQDASQLDGVVTLRLNSDGKLAIATACRAKTVALYSRDEMTGELSLLSMRRKEPFGELSVMEWPTEAIFSNDDKFIYAVDDRQGTVLVFRIDDGNTLSFVEVFHGPDGCLSGARGINLHPDGKTLYVSCHRACTLVVLNRDPETGKVGIRQILRDEEDGVHGLAGTIDTCVSRDGKYVYTVSGRWAGDDAIGAFQVGADGKLTVLQEFINNQSDLKGFEGGAKGIMISPDGKRFYASGARSRSLACFNRNPDSGKLEYVTTIKNLVTGDRTEERPGDNLGANGIDLSPDGRFLYLALENGAAISVLEWTAPTPQP